jgi:serine phosphatase RsbU (regulator of sigma subunit)
MAKKKYYLIVLFITIINFCFAQQTTIEDLENALRDAKTSKNDREVVMATIEIGDYYYEKKDFKKAEKYYSKAMSLSQSVKDYKGNLMAKYKLGFINLSKNDFDGALLWFKDALGMAKEQKMYDLVKDINQNISDVEQRKMDEEKSRKITKLNTEEALKLLEHMEQVEQENNKRKEENEKRREENEQVLEKLGKVEQEKSKREEENENFLVKIKKLSIDKQLAAIELKFKEQEIEAKEHEINGKKMQINLLNKENELKKTELAKQEALAQTQKIIITFSLTGLLLVVALTFFIFRNYKQKQKANELLVAKNLIIETKNKEIMDSINYAKKIQEAMLLTSRDLCKTIFTDHFIMYLPKDIVSGDFYWAYSAHENQVIWTVADCTGHGVPGAFMNMIGSSLLNEIVIERGISTANNILDELKNGIMKALGQNGATGDSRDGMDAAICVWHKDTNKLEYAGAFNPLYLVRKNKLIILEADRKPVGWWLYSDTIERPFTLQEIQLEKGDMIYLFSDGYVDQFGGEHGKKFSRRRFKDILLSIHNKPMEEQNDILHETFESWKSHKEEQVDDICVIGVKI